MKLILITLFALAATTAACAKTITVTVRNVRYQTVTGFGAAACDGAMCPYGTDIKPVQLLYGPNSKIGLNIIHMAISPYFKGDITAADAGRDTPYGLQGRRQSVPQDLHIERRPDGSARKVYTNKAKG